MTTQHTPGPWEVHSRQPTFIRANGGKKHIASTASMGDEAESKLNARLIAAAPDLLEIAIRLSDEGLSTSLVKEARAAIAKATGSAA